MVKRPLQEFNVQTKQIYRTIVEYVGGQGEKERPVIIVAVNESEYVAITLKITKTGVDPEKNRPWDKYKVPVYNWRRAGLMHPSYVECSRVIEIDGDALVEYVGEAHQSDFKRIINEFKRFARDSNKASIGK